MTKKMTLQEAMQQKLASKKQQAKQSNKHMSTETKSMKSQITKKPNNQKKRMGI